MGKISFKPRTNTNGTIGVSINYSHKAHIDKVPFQKKVSGVTIAPNEFNKTTGRVINRKDAGELNKLIQALLSDVEYCLAECERNGVEPFKRNLDTEYEKLQHLKTLAPAAKKILGRTLDMLRSELAELEKQVTLKKLEIEQEEKDQGVHVSKLFTSHIDSFLKENTTLKPSSIKNYTSLKSIIENWKPTLNITDINKTLLNNFREYLTTNKDTRVIDHEAMSIEKEINPEFNDIIYIKGMRNSSVRELLQKMKIVYYFYADKFGYDISSVKKWKSGLKKVQNDKVVFLSKDELEAVTHMPTETDQELIHRDFYVFMANTGLRFVDALKVRKHHIQEIDGGLKIKILQEKTTKMVEVPVTADALRVLEFHNYNFAFDKETGTGIKYTAQVGYFMNKMMKRADIGCYTLIRTNFKNNVGKEDNTKLKRELILSHTARKTFINKSLNDGMKITAIKNIVGHSELDMIMNVYGDGSLNTDEMSKAGWVMPTESSTSKMKIA
ncbi:tyrosine-type recombinase/integrase [Hymenobacter persicinus]|nr:tyrosine-type recombinase/integrase [Hymenobacter persicinus]